MEKSVDGGNACGNRWELILIVLVTINLLLADDLKKENGKLWDSTWKNYSFLTSKTAI